MFHAEGGEIGVVIRAVTFFETEYFLLGNGTVAKLPLPLSANLQGITIGGVTHLIVTLREDWKRDGDDFKKGSLLALTLDPFLENKARDACSSSLCAGRARFRGAGRCRRRRCLCRHFRECHGAY